MDKLANVFSVLTLDAEDDTDQITTLVAAKDESKSPKSAKDGKKGESSGKDNSLKNSKKAESSVKENSQKNGRLNQEILASSSTDYKMPLVWIDLEMTGLDVTTDRILEIACIITDGKLTKSIEGPDFVISQTKECLDKMGEWCREHHAASGLTKRVLQSTISERDAEKQVIEFVKKHIGSDTPLLAGNSIYVDFLFLKKRRRLLQRRKGIELWMTSKKASGSSNTTRKAFSNCRSPNSD
ncbi:oligoribonuclease isoform X2 [Ananas comosus]|uniref:Oligoribonuclease isoform X2 n=1 Tax=Ananas comosus TaxID=4615 RepID=A0A6P5FNA9_ANACO|nr:oligoribonuclease isoform X2 [Ananas comosus]